MADTWVEEPELEKEEELAAVSQVWCCVKKRRLTAHAHKSDDLEVITEYKTGTWEPLSSRCYF